MKKPAKFEKDVTEGLCDSFARNLLKPFGAKLDAESLKSFIFGLQQFPFLLRELTGRDALMLTPSKLEESAHKFGERDLVRLAQFIGLSPFFSDSLKEHMRLELAFHLSNNRKDKSDLGEVLEEIEDIPNVPQREQYREIYVKYKSWVTEPKGYLFEHHKSLILASKPSGKTKRRRFTSTPMRSRHWLATYLTGFPQLESIQQYRK